MFCHISTLSTMTNATHSNENVTIHLKVKDYATWRTPYDGREKSRLSAGITNGRAFSNAGIILARDRQLARIHELLDVS